MIDWGAKIECDLYVTAFKEQYSGVFNKCKVTLPPWFKCKSRPKSRPVKMIVFFGHENRYKATIKLERIHAPQQ